MNSVSTLFSRFASLCTPLTAVFLLTILGTGCRESRVSDHPEWGARFKAYGIDSGCFIMRDHAHEVIHYFNKARSTQRYSPASTFKILNSLIALETGEVADENTVRPWDGVPHEDSAWNHDMDMREAFRLSNVPFYQDLARRIGRQTYQRYLDTIKYGNMKIGAKEDAFWLDNSLQITADEQIGFIRKLYFSELPFLERNQEIVKNIMLREDSVSNRYYYKTGMGQTSKGADLFWVVGYLEHAERYQEHEKSMNKTGVRNYPYFFALNFEVPAGDTTKDWLAIRIKLVHELLNEYGATRD
jgi:beta-lactamase class D